MREKAKCVAPSLDMKTDRTTFAEDVRLEDRVIDEKDDQPREYMPMTCDNTSELLSKLLVGTSSDTRDSTCALVVDRNLTFSKTGER